MVMLQFQFKEFGERVVCLEVQVSNGKIVVVFVVFYVVVGVVGVVLIMSGIFVVGVVFLGVSVVVSGVSVGGMGIISFSFIEVFGWFQGMVMNGMMLVNYFNVY